MATWIQTYTGRAFDPFAFSEDDLNLLDIAQALSQIVRYNGHVEGHYSVAQHSVILADYVFKDRRSWKDARTMLLHDSAEAYVGDMVAPLKRRFPAFVEMEDAILRGIMFKFDGIYPLPDWVKSLDVAILNNEKEALYGPEPKPWSIPPQRLEIPHIEPWPARMARDRFLEAHARYS